MVENNNDEFHFSDLETDANSVMDVEPSTTPKNSFQAVEFMQRRVWMVAGALFVLWAIYSLSSFWWGSKNTRIKSNFDKPQAIQPLVQKPSKNLHQLEAPRLDSMVINQISKDRTQLNQALTELTSQVRVMKQTMRDLDTRLVDMNFGQQKLLERLQQQQALLKSLKPKAVVASHVGKKSSKPIYFIKAIMPGRAWLVNTSGTTLTVKVNDSVPGYGQVNQILPEKGIIELAQGGTIGFNPNDS